MNPPAATSNHSRARRGKDLSQGRGDDRDRRYQRVLAVITDATTTARPASVAALARAAQVHRSYLYRHPELLELIQHAQRLAPEVQGDDAEVSSASLRADLAHARDRAGRAEATIRQLKTRLSRALGQQVWADTGLGPPDPLADAQRQLETLRQELLDTRAALDERDQELDAARATNRQLMATLNSPR